jgi:hypothetical protein
MSDGVGDMSGVHVLVKIRGAFIVLAQTGRDLVARETASIRALTVTSLSGSPFGVGQVELGKRGVDPE